MVGADYDEPEVVTDSITELMEWGMWMIGGNEDLNIKQLPGLRAVMSFKSRTIVPNAVRAWKRAQ